MSPALADLKKAGDRLIPLEQARDFTTLLYALDVDDLEDEDFEKLEQLIDQAIRLLADGLDAAHRQLIAKLLVAREGIEQGMAPDPDKRPSREEIRKHISSRLNPSGSPTP